MCFEEGGMVKKESLAVGTTPGLLRLTQPKRGLRALPILILLVAFALRMWLFGAMVRYPDRFFQVDSHSYHSLAINLLRFHRFGSFDQAGVWVPHVDRTPPYPVFLATNYAIFGSLPAAAIMIQILVSTLTVALAYHLGRRWGNARAGTLIALLMSIEVGSVLYANQVMTETLFSCVFLGGMVAWSAMIWRKQWACGFLSGIMLGLAALIRPALMYFGPVGGLLSLLLYRGDRRRRWLATLSLVLAFVLVVAPWMMRNYVVAGQAQLSTVQAATLLFYNVRQLRAYRQGISTEVAYAQLVEEVERETFDVVQQDQAMFTAYCQRKAIAEIRAYWRDYAIVHLKGSLAFFVIPTAGTMARALGWVRTGTGLLSNLMTRGVSSTWQSFRDFRRRLSEVGHDDWLFFGTVGYESLYLLLLNAGAIWGGIRCLRTRRWDLLLLTVTVIGYFALVTGPVSYDARYRIPVMPFLALLATMALP